MKNIRHIVTLTPDEGLDKQFIFWLVIVLPILVAISLGIPVWIEYSFGLNESAYNTFIIVSKLPLGIASLAIPLGVLVGRLHGTKQTALQIQHTKQDNKTKLYLSHFDHFCTHIDFVESSLIDRFSLIIPDESKLIINKLSMYRLIYPHNSLVNGVKPAGSHLSVFAVNTMDMLIKSYKDFLYSNNDNFKSKLRALEDEFINVQLRCFQCHKTRSSIFIKHVNNELRRNLIFGASPNLSDYYFQVEFFLELLDGIEAFELNNSEERAGYKILSSLRAPHSRKPHESEDIVAMWEVFKIKYFGVKETA